jgi:DNA-binding CsgD family transcriptional regulator
LDVPRQRGSRALRDLREALALADECGDAGAIATAITSLVMAEPSTGHATLGLLERALSLDPAAHDPILAYSLGSALALVRLYQGRLDDARALSERLLADAEALGHEAGRMNGLRLLAQVEFRAGQWGEAARYATEARELMLQISPQPVVAYVKAVIDAHLGRVDEARTAAREWIAFSERAGSFYGRMQHTSVLGLLELGLGNADTADRLLRPLVDEFVRMGWTIELIFPSGEPIDAVIAVGELELARDLLDRFQREGEAFDSHWIAAAADRCRGLLLAAEGDLAGAQTAFESALAAQEQNGWPFERARTLLALGQMQRRAKHRRAARQTLQTALTLFDELGARLWARQANAELARIGGRAPGSGELTATEERVAALVAEGRTNKEAAAALYLSPHTVEGHLSRIYAKLGIRSRTELAHRLAGTAARSSDD